MADEISVPIESESITVTIEAGAASRLVEAVQTIDFAIPLTIDASTYKDWKCMNASGDTTLNLTGIADGEAGILEIYNSASGTTTIGSMFTKNAGGGIMETAASGDNIIAWIKSGTDIIFSIIQIE